MTEFDNLKNTYIATMQCAMAMGRGNQWTKHGNDILHKFCEMLVDRSDYPDADKQAMKQELELLKESIDAEIDACYHGYNITYGD